MTDYEDEGVESYDEPVPDTLARAVEAPFTHPLDFDFLVGHCSRCKERALLSERRWWHDGPACHPRYFRTARFILGGPAAEQPTP